MRRRHFIAALTGVPMMTLTVPAGADSSGPQLASYYERHMAQLDGVAYGWLGRGQPSPLRDGVRQVGVSRDAFHALQRDGRLLRLHDDPARDETLMEGVRAFASGQSGWFALDEARVLWHGTGAGAPPQRVADQVREACIGDGADYHVRDDGTLWVKGLAHRGQYGDGKLTAHDHWISTAREAVAVRAHTGHAIYLDREGTVFGTGGNRFGPLGAHGLGDKADRWGRIFDGAIAIATGSRHSAAIRADGSLWVWGEGHGIEPRQRHTDVLAVAAGDTATLALLADGSLLQWDGGDGPRRLRLG